VFKINTLTRKHNITGLIIGLIFGFLLQRGGLTDYDILVGQLLLKDYTVFKVMITAILTGMIGVSILNYMGKIDLSLKTGSLGSLIMGGIIFGIGFGLLGYCPGTLVGAVGQGSLDALIGGVPGIILGAGFFANVYPRIQNSIFEKHPIKKASIVDYVKINRFWVITIVSLILVMALIIIELFI